MKRPILLLVLLSSILTLKAQQVDPYHTATGGFGYPVASSPEATLWWAEGTYKIMQDMPAPKGKARPVNVAAAKNEWESFQIVVRPERELSQVKVTLSDLKSGKGTIPSTAFTVRKVEYVLVKHPTVGYFLPDEGEKGKREARAFIAFMTGRARSELKSTKAARKLLEGGEGV